MKDALIAKGKSSVSSAWFGPSSSSARAPFRDRPATNRWGVPMRRYMGSTLRNYRRDEIYWAVYLAYRGAP